MSATFCIETQKVSTALRVVHTDLHVCWARLYHCRTVRRDGGLTLKNMIISSNCVFWSSTSQKLWITTEAVAVNSICACDNIFSMQLVMAQRNKFRRLSMKCRISVGHLRSQDTALSSMTSMFEKSKLTRK